MSQVTTWPIAPGPSGLAMRQQINLTTDALRTSNSGASAPTAPDAGMAWFDTSVGVMKHRDVSNTGWDAVMTAAKGGTGPGQFLERYAAPSSSLTIPAGGTWIYHYLVRILPSGTVNTQKTGIAAGGTILYVAGASEDVFGFVWRIS